MRGGGGDDVYLFELGIQIFERAYAGTDTTLCDSGTAYARDTVFNANNVERLLIGGSVHVKATGPVSAELIAGSTADNLI